MYFAGCSRICLAGGSAGLRASGAWQPSRTRIGRKAKTQSISATCHVGAKQRWWNGREWSKQSRQSRPWLPCAGPGQDTRTRIVVGGSSGSSIGIVAIEVVGVVVITAVAVSLAVVTAHPVAAVAEVVGMVMATAQGLPAQAGSAATATTMVTNNRPLHARVCPSWKVLWQELCGMWRTAAWAP